DRDTRYAPPCRLAARAPAAAKRRQPTAARGILAFSFEPLGGPRCVEREPARVSLSNARARQASELSGCAQSYTASGRALETRTAAQASRITFHDAGASVARRLAPLTSMPLSGAGLMRSGWSLVFNAAKSVSQSW